MIKISIVMPCYNMAAFIRECLDSLQRQTLSEFEAICVDDGSTDETPDIICEYMTQDRRIKLVRQKNLGVFAARNNAMKVAGGEYICFLDPDDWYPADDTLERMYKTASDNDAEICGGGWSRHYPDGRVDTRFDGFMEGLNTFSKCEFLDYSDYQFDLGYQRFLFRTSLIKNNKIEFPPYKRFQDPPFLVKAMVAAGRLYTLDFVTYCYRVGHKSVDWSSDDYRKLKDYFRGLADNMRVAKANHLEKLFQNNRDRACGSFFWQTAGNAISSRRDVFEVYQQMFDDPLDMLRSLVAGYARHPRDLVAMLEKNNVVLKPYRRKITTIGIHYYHLTVGGVQRVIAIQVREFLRQGYRVVVFIEEKEGGCQFNMPDGVDVVAFPRTLGKDSVPPSKRIEEVVRILREHPVDVFYSHAHMSPFMLWDILSVKMVCKIPYILHYHSMFTAPLYASWETTYDRFLEAIPQHRLCDCVISLSRGDLAYERMNGVNAIYLPNPVDPELASIPITQLPNDPLVIWVGRLDEQKYPLDAVRIFAKVHESIPSAKMRMIGGGAEWLESRVKKLVADLKLGDSIELTGTRSDVYADYWKASVCLSTSRIEGFPMVSFEALCHGVPLVAYALPQVEIYRDNSAVIQVKQGDILGAAEMICQLLGNNDKLEHARAEARKSIIPFMTFDFVSAWRTIFASLERGDSISTHEISKRDYCVMLETLFSGIEAMRNRVGALRKQVADRDKALLDRQNAVTNDARDVEIERLQQEVIALKGDMGKMAASQARGKAADGVKLLMQRAVESERRENENLNRALAAERRAVAAERAAAAARREAEVGVLEKSQRDLLAWKLREVDELHHSFAYRTGMIVTAPLRAIKRALSGKKR